MGPMLVKCQGGTWQEDFAALVPSLLRYYRGAFKRCYDPEEHAQEALCWSMEFFQRLWEPGAVIAFWKRDGLRRSAEGQRWVRKAEYGGVTGVCSVQALFPLYEGDAVAGGAFTRYTRRDLELDAAELSATHAQAVRLLMTCDNERGRGHMVAGERIPLLPWLKEVAAYIGADSSAGVQ